MTIFTAKEISALSPLAAAGNIDLASFSQDNTVLSIADIIASAEVGKPRTYLEIVTLLWNDGKPTISGFYLNDKNVSVVGIANQEVVIDQKYLTIKFETSQKGSDYALVTINAFDSESVEDSLELYAAPVLNARAPQQFIHLFTNGKLTSADFESPALPYLPDGEYQVLELQTAASGKSAKISVKIGDDTVKVRVVPGRTKVGDTVISKDTRLTVKSRFAVPTSDAINPGIGGEVTDPNTILQSGGIYKLVNAIARNTKSVTVDVYSPNGLLGTIWKTDAVMLFQGAMYATITKQENANATSGYSFSYKPSDEVAFLNQPTLEAPKTEDAEVAF